MAKSVWDEIKDMFKTKSQREEEEQQQLNDAREKQKDIIDKLGELEQQYNDSLPPEEEVDLDALFPEESGYKELEYELDSDEDIAKKAKDMYESDRAADRLKVNGQYAEDRANTESKKQVAEKNLQQTFEDLRAAYDELAQNVKNISVKNGVARGSIMQSALDDAAASQQSAENDARKNYAETMRNIDMQLENLAAERDNALEQLDLRYAADVDAQIQKLTKQRDDAKRKYDEYNNDIRQKQEKYQREREQDIAEFLQQRKLNEAKLKAQQADFESLYGYEGEKEQNYLKRYNLAFDFYKAMSPEIAVEALESAPEMKYYLGYYYKKLLNTLKGNIES